jgi:hypothetical protein
MQDLTRTPQAGTHVPFWHLFWLSQQVMVDPEPQT